MTTLPTVIVAFHPDTAPEERVAALIRAIGRVKLPKSALLALIEGLTMLVEDAPVARARRPCPILRGNEPFGAQAVEDRIDAICGCNGRWNCDCVSVFNRALGELWYEHNTKGVAP